MYNFNATENAKYIKYELN